MKSLFLSLCCVASLLCNAQNNVKIINAPATEIASIHQKLQEVAGIGDFHLVAFDTACSNPVHVLRCVHEFSYSSNTSGPGLRFLYQIRGNGKNTPFVGTMEANGSYERIIRLYKFLIDSNVNEAELKELRTTKNPPRLGTLRIKIYQVNQFEDNWLLQIF